MILSIKSSFTNTMFKYNGSQHKILATKVISYLLNLPNFTSLIMISHMYHGIIYQHG
jgi:hypothetical protein